MQDELLPGIARCGSCGNTKGKTPVSDLIKRAASISKDGKYRYSLLRQWDPSKRKVIFLMLNPSTADGETDDATIRRCIEFAKSWGYGSLLVGNLYALRATDPDQLWQESDPVGPENDRTIAGMALWADAIVCAWGAKGKQDRASRVLSIIEAMWRGQRQQGAPLYCLGRTQAGEPLHPLRLSSDLSLQQYDASGRIVDVVPVQSSNL